MLWPWVVSYLAFDAAYVYASRGAYMDVVSDIAGGAPKNIAKVALCAIGAYILMAIGWACIVVPATRKGRALEAARTGALYGLILYGVFNCTTGAMFDKWTYEIMARDTAWGVTSLSAVTAAYSLTRK